MVPRTKLQVRIFGLSQKLPKITLAQEQWAFKNCLEHVAYRTKKTVSCLDCGHIWAGPQKVKSCTCPSCGVKLLIQDTLKKKYDQIRRVIALIDVVDGFQLNRFFEIYSYHKSGEKPRQHIWEIVQQWFIPGEKLTVVARTCSYGSSGFSGSLEIRGNLQNYWNSNKYDIWADKVFPKVKCLPVLKRNGFNGKVYGVSPYSLMLNLLKDPKLETLIKSNQFELVSARLGDRSGKVNRFWDSIKICIRNKYIIKDASSYLDYLDLLIDFGKDIYSPKYVCPVDFEKEHTRYVEKKARKQRDERTAQSLKDAEKRKLLVEKEQKQYIQDKGGFFGLLFKDGELTVKILESVHEFIQEGAYHNHCIYTNSYYKKPDSLCFSASVDGSPIETVEVSLSEMRVIQSRGLHNNSSAYHDQIIALVSRNLNQIRNRYKAKDIAA